MKRKRSHSTSFLIKRCLILITNFIKFGKCEKVTVFLLHFVCQTLYPYCPNKFFFRLLMLWSLFILFHFFPILQRNLILFFLSWFFLEATQTASWIINQWARVHPVLHNSITKPPPHQRHRLVALAWAVIRH